MTGSLKNGDPDWAERVGFALGTGRCGTTFLAEVAAREPHVAAVKERNPLNETFHRYCRWYDLPVDDEGFLRVKEDEIRADLRASEFSFESSAYLSLSLDPLFRRFGAKFILLVRHPMQVVNSYLVKGWYNQPVVRSNPALALGYQPCDQFHHFLGRIVPSGATFDRWNRLTRVGKLAWYWSALNNAVADQFEGIPESHWRIVRLEDLDFDCYQRLATFLGYESRLRRSDFDELVRARPNAFPTAQIQAAAAWDADESREFNAEAAETARRFGYEA